MNRYNLGSALVDYVVPTALVGILVGLGLFGILKSGVLTNFFAASGNIDINGGKAVMNSNNPTGNTLVSGASSSVEVPAGPDKTPLIQKGPGLQLPDDAVEIDFGDFVLKGIPEDFGDYIEATGNSGGTDLLANLLKQIAMEADVDSSTKNLILQLANNGHSIAGKEREIETIANEALIDIAKNQSPEENGAEAMDAGTDLLWENSQILSSLDGCDEIKKFDSTLDKIISSMGSSSDPKTQAVYESVLVLAREIQDIASEVSSNASSTIDATGNEPVGNLNSIVKPDGSKRTDVNSGLICANGSGHDSGTQCSG